MKTANHSYEMSSIGVVVFRNTLPKMQVLQESVNNSKNIANNDPNKPPRREIIIVRKKQKIQSPPGTVSVTSLVHAAENGNRVPVKKVRLRDDGSEEPTRNPTPLAVARRNARERNRVRQVNDGFAALRRHIPDEVAEIFEGANSNRGPNKKLSKVETLRMAVEYIRNLESLLNMGHASDKENTSQPSMESFPSPASSSPRDNSFERSYYSLNSPLLEDEDMEEEDMESGLSQIPQHQYTTMPIPENFPQLISTPHLYEDEERGQTLTPSSDMLAQEDLVMSPHILEGSFPFGNSAEQFTVINTQNTYTENGIVLNDNISEYELKYAETLQTHMNTNYDDSSNLSFETLNAGIILEQEQFKFKTEKPIHNNNYDEIDLKKELPEIHVTPEDREQFEETLKWWQEKTRNARPILKTSKN